jgi:selenocysteine-specific translation elongation factor
VVILGIAASGIIQKHANLNVLPGIIKAQVRSIQKHDDEFDVAGEGDRVGLALKNIEIEDLDRGTVLTNDPDVKTTSKLETTASLVKYWQTPIKQGMVMHIGHWTQFITAKAEAISETMDSKKPALALTLEKPLVYCRNDKVVLMYLEGAKLRVAGTIELH